MLTYPHCGPAQHLRSKGIYRIVHRVIDISNSNYLAAELMDCRDCCGPIHRQGPAHHGTAARGCARSLTCCSHVQVRQGRHLISSITYARQQPRCDEAQLEGATHRGASGVAVPTCTIRPAPSLVCLYRCSNSHHSSTCSGLPSGFWRPTCLMSGHDYKPSRLQ